MYNHIFFSYQKPTLCKVGFFSDFIESVLKPNVDWLTQIESETLIFPTIKIESVYEKLKSILKTKNISKRPLHIYMQKEYF